MRAICLFILCWLLPTSAAIAASSGRFIQPGAGSSVAGNILLSVQAQDPEGLSRVYVSFDNSAQYLELCQSAQQCLGTNFSITLPNVNPATYAAKPGLIKLQLWTTNSIGVNSSVATQNINWQPLSLNNLKAQRSADGTEISLSWDPNPTVLRYNLYLASATGVNRTTYRQLPDGQARLALKSTAESFSALNPAKAYYLLLTGLSGSGEAALAAEIALPSPQQPPPPPPPPPPLNQSPIAVADSYSTVVNQVLQVAAAQGLLANDSDPDGDPLTVSSTAITPPQSGTLLLAGDGSFSYTPQANFSGNDSFIYQISDGKGGTAQASVSIQVNALANNPPVAMNDSYSLTMNQSLQITAALGLLANDSDPDGDPLTVNPTAMTLPQAGTLLLAIDGSFSYTPNLNFSGNDSFIYQISDGKGGTAQATVVLQVTNPITNITGDSLSMTGEFLYIGVGENPLGSQIGTGLYRIGDCIQLIDTSCSMQGRYQEAAQSGHVPGQQGNYVFVMTYPGIGNSPVLAKSVQANSNSLQFVSTGQARFELSLFPDSGGKFTSLYPASPFANSLSFGAFIQANASCLGLVSNQICSIGMVGRVAGAEIRAQLNNLSFTIPGSALSNSGPVPPQAGNDQYQVSTNQTLNISAPGVLTNDLESKSLLQGNQLQVKHSFNPDLGSLVGLAANEYQQTLYIYPAFGVSVHKFDRIGQNLGSLPMQGEGANDVDLDIAPQAFVLKNTEVPQGSLLIINGETGVAEIYAVDAASGSLLTKLDTTFGASHVVGGAYNAVSGTIWLLQDNVPAGSQGNLVAQIDPKTGQVISSFNVVNNQHNFNVSFGDLHINPHNGNILLVSSIQSTMAEFDRNGNLVRQLTLPAAVNNLSGLAVSADGNKFWLASTSGMVFELGFANQGTVPTLMSLLQTGPTNGSLLLRRDGSFSYTPNANFVGQDSFSYKLIGAFGGSSQATVTINVQ